MLDRIGGRGRIGILVGVAFGWCLALGVRHVVPALLPFITAEFAVSNAAAGAAVTLLWLVYAGMQFPGGLATDRVGERVVLAGSLLLGGVGAAAFALTPTFTVFLGACALFGFGTGLFGTPRVTVLSNRFPERDGTALGITFAAGNVGAAVLPLIAGLLATAFGWRAGFAVTVPLFALAGIGLWIVVRNDDGRRSSNPSENRIDWQLLRAALADRSVLLLSGGMVLTLFSLQGLTAFLVVYLVAIKGLAPSFAAGLLGAFFATSALVQPIAGRVADAYGRRPTLVTVAGFHALALLALPLVDGRTALVALVVCLGVRGGIGPVNNAAIVDALPRAVQGSGYGLLRTVYMAIAATGSTVVGLAADAGYFDEAFVLLAGLMVVATVLYRALPAMDATESPGGT